MILFAKNDPMHFGNLQLSLLTLFRASTLDDWTDIMYVNMYGCDRHEYVYGKADVFGPGNKGKKKLRIVNCNNPQAFGCTYLCSVHQRCLLNLNLFSYFNDTYITKGLERSTWSLSSCSGPLCFLLFRGLSPLPAASRPKTLIVFCGFSPLPAASCQQRKDFESLSAAWQPGRQPKTSKVF